MNPKITVVTAAFNSAGYIEKAIQSVRNQTYQNVEHWVIDGGSTDGTVEILKRYGDRLKWISEKDTGIYNALNKGFARATGEIITWLDSDNYYADSHVLERVAQAFTQSSEPDVVLTDCEIVYPDHGERERIRPQSISFETLLEKGNQFIPESIFYKKTLFDKVGGLNERYRLLADYDLWLKLFKEKPVLVQLPFISASFTARADALLRKNPWRSWQEGIAIGRAHGRSIASRVKVRLQYAWERIKLPVAKKVKKYPSLYRLYHAYGRPLLVAGRRQLVRTDVLTILTLPPKNWSNIGSHLSEGFKKGIRTAFFRIFRHPRFMPGGPTAVLNSLTTGLHELGIPFQVNPWEKKIGGPVGVLSGADALRWAITAKQQGKISTLIAGPNIVVAPTDEENLIKSAEIDQVIVPSEWNKRWWMSFDQLFDSRAKVWPAGVTDRGVGRTASGVCIVYAKNADEKLFHKVIEMLWTHKLPIAVSRYGQFRQEEYFRLLKKAKMLVYLSESESQGLALHEAWMADVPTLVYNRGYFEYQDKRFNDQAAAAPYLTDECGMFFGENDFEQKLVEFLKNYDSFTPRQYSLGRFTDGICARKYVDIVEAVKK